MAETRTQQLCFLFCAFPFESASSEGGVMFFQAFLCLLLGRPADWSFSGAHLCEQGQYHPGTCSDGHLNMQRISLITLTSLWLESESDGARSRRGKSKIAPVKGSQCLVPKHPGSCSVITFVIIDILQGTESPTASQMRLRLPLASFPAETREVWELDPFQDCRGIPCQQEGQRIPHALSLAPLHAEVGMLSYQTKPDLSKAEKSTEPKLFSFKAHFPPPSLIIW